MIIDSFLFFNELDLLEIRLNSLAPYVDRFVLCESPQTHSGQPKPLYFAENRERFKDFPITHLVAPAQPGTPWELEHRQREYLMTGIADAPDDATILLSDLDEIPNLEGYDGREGAFKQRLYYYYLNCYTNTRRWKLTVATKRKHIRTLSEIREWPHRNRLPGVVSDGGWHFSTLGTAEQIIQKIESFAHTELDTPERKRRIAENREKLQDPYNRTPQKWEGFSEFHFTIEMPSGPKWLLDNRDRYPHLFYA